MGPVLPPRSTICGPPSHHHYSAPLNFRKGLVSKCTWKCTAIIVIMLSVVLMSTLIYITGKFSFFYISLDIFHLIYIFERLV